MHLFCSFLLVALTLAAEPADWIWSARYVLTGAAKIRVIENGAVAVRGDRIAALGSRAEIDRRFQPKQRLDRPDALIAPGLINTHTQAGMRGVLGETIIGFPVADAKTPADSLKLAEQFLIRFAKDPLIVPAVAPHAIYTNSDETLKAARTLANRYHAPVLIHLSETKRE